MQIKRPNFLFFITDQQRADHLSCAGNPILKTPNIDSLADRGWRFDHFYANSGVCQTNRATIHNRPVGYTAWGAGERYTYFTRRGLLSAFAPSGRL